MYDICTVGVEPSKEENDVDRNYNAFWRWQRVISQVKRRNVFQLYLKDYNVTVYYEMGCNYHHVSKMFNGWML